jgi:hypothetical protein
MQAMAWWSVPLVAFIVAMVWVSVANRPRPRAKPHESMAEHERFRQAILRPVDGNRPAPSDRHGAPAAPRRADDRTDPDPGDGRPASA